MYNVVKIQKENIFEIKNDWKKLEQGSDMTYFQSYDWTEMLIKYAPANNWWYESAFFSVEKDGMVLLIAPVWIIKHDYKLINKRGCYFFARYEWSDYVNLVYDQFDSHALEVLFSFLKEKYSIKSCYFENLKEETSLYKYIIMYKNVQSNSVATCVELHLPDSVEDYFVYLSKNSRQNIRTAYNRMKKNDIEHSVIMEDSDIDRNECILLREQRCVTKGRKKKFSINTVKYKLIEKFLLFRFKDYIPIKDDANSKFISFYSENELKAFFNYGYSKHVNTVYAMSAGFDYEYSKYSPGLIAMYEFILNAIEGKTVKTVDFTRGTEFYKYTLGGTEHFIHNVKFEI